MSLAVAFAFYSTIIPRFVRGDREPCSRNKKTTTPCWYVNHWLMEPARNELAVYAKSHELWTRTILPRSGTRPATSNRLFRRSSQNISARYGGVENIICTSRLQTILQHLSAVRFIFVIHFINESYPSSYVPARISGNKEIKSAKWNVRSHNQYLIVIQRFYKFLWFFHKIICSLSAKDNKSFWTVYY